MAAVGVLVGQSSRKKYFLQQEKRLFRGIPFA
jgi:hypothetical protein